MSILYDFAGGGFQGAGRPDKEKDVVSKHEDKVNSTCHRDCHHFNNCLIGHLELLQLDPFFVI